MTIFQASESSKIIISSPFNVNQNLKIVEDIGFVGKKGDVNNDNNANVIDITNIIYTILNEIEVEPTYMWAGDMDFTLELNVNDIIKLVAFVLLPEQWFKNLE